MFQTDLTESTQPNLPIFSTFFVLLYRRRAFVLLSLLVAAAGLAFFFSGHRAWAIAL